MYCFFYPAMTTGSVPLVLLIFMGDKGDVFIFVLADQNVRLWGSLCLWMLVAVHLFLLSSRRSAHCRWAWSLGRGTLAGLLSWLDVTSPSAACASICHLAFILLWEVEICTQPCFRRMTWTCQTADKAKNLSKSWVRGEQPSPPLQICFHLSAENSPYPRLNAVMIYPAGRCCPLHWGAVWNVQGFLPAAEKEGGEASAWCQGEGRTLLAMPGGEAHAAVDVAVDEWLESDVL